MWYNFGSFVYILYLYIIFKDNKKSSAAVAQSAEHFLGKEEVMGSIPISSSVDKSYKAK